MNEWPWFSTGASMFQAEGTVCAKSWRNGRKQNVHGEGGSGKRLHFWGQGKVIYGASGVEEAKGENSELREGHFPYVI